jgi:hypothetical protein
MGNCGVLGGDAEQVGRPLALLPQRGALVGAALGQQQRPGGRLPKRRGERRRRRQGRHDQRLGLVRVDHQLLERQLLDRLGQADDDAVVGPHHLDCALAQLLVPAVGQALAQRHRPGGVHPAAERRQHADAPVTDLVAKPFDDDRVVVGDDRGGLGLIVEVAEQVVGGPLVQPCRPQAGGTLASLGGAQLAHERPDRPSQFHGAAGPVAVPERHLAGLTGGRGDHHLLEGDVLDAPGGGAQQEGLAHPALVDHLLVELPHPGAVGQDHPHRAPGRGWCRPT